MQLTTHYSASRAKGTTFVTEYLFLSAGYYMDLRHPLDLPTANAVCDQNPTYALYDLPFRNKRLFYEFPRQRDIGVSAPTSGRS